MNMKSVKKATEIKLADIAVEIHTKDTSITGVTLKDCIGGSLTIQANGWGSGIEVLIPASPAMVKRWSVAGKLKGIAFDETFEHEHEALARMTVIGVEADPCELTQVEMPEPA